MVLSESKRDTIGYGRINMTGYSKIFKLLCRPKLELTQTCMATIYQSWPLVNGPSASIVVDLR